MEMFSHQYTVVKCGMRNVTVRRIRDGEIEHVPNSKVVQEKVISYEGWEKRRCQLNVAIDADTEGDKVGELKRAVGEYVAKLEEVKPSDPCCYCTGFTGGGLEVEVVYYINNYQDDIAKFKKVNDGVTMALKHNIDRLQIKVYKPFSV